MQKTFIGRRLLLLALLVERYISRFTCRMEPLTCEVCVFLVTGSTLDAYISSAPYLYDGRAATMKDIFTIYNKKDEHGSTSDLTEQELDDLVEYVNSL